jgi:N-glycosylase/DNA lyase
VTTPFSARIDLAATLQSGQVFHWNQNADASWSGLIGSMPVRVSEKNRCLVVHEGDHGTIARHFALDHPLEQIAAAFPNDPMSQAALSACEGMRILRQPRWECTATFITSSMKQVAHIRSMSLAIRERIGTRPEGSKIQAYPSFEKLAGSTESVLRDCGLGYRAANLLQTARILAEDKLNLDTIAKQKTPMLRKSLTTLPGVGVKVANCILLFAYERLDAVPIDTWIHRILLTMRGGRHGTATELANYARRRLGPYAGYVQQYLFHHARSLKRAKSPTSGIN